VSTGEDSDGVVSLSVLGTAVGMNASVAADWPSLLRTKRAPVATVLDTEPSRALAELTQLAICHSPLLCIHAGVVHGSQGLLVIPGTSGLGKSTLVAALVSAGFDYVSDEALAIDRITLRATPFPRPLTLDGSVWNLIGTDLGPGPPPGSEQLISVARLGGVHTADGYVSHIVLGRREPGPILLEPASRGAAVGELIARSFNHFKAPEASFRAIVAMVRQAEVWNARYTEAAELAAALFERLSA
jgi:hypothetical protein